VGDRRTRSAELTRAFARRFRLLDPRNGPDWDVDFVGSHRTYVIASLPRTGSTLLCRALWQSGQVGAPKEYLNPMQLRDWSVRRGSIRHAALRGPLLGLMHSWPRPRCVAHLRDVAAHRTGPSGWFGLKVHWHHWERWRTFVQPRPIAWVLLTREDRVAQAVSWARALQTGRWASHQRGWSPPIYSHGRIARALGRIERHEAAWRSELAGEPQVLALTYEQVTADLSGAVQRVLAHLGEPRSAVRVVPQLEPQHDAVSVRWHRRFSAESGRR
jgi:LPS sulfotransferase NodH